MLLDFVMFPRPHQVEKKKKLCCWGALWSTSSPTGDALVSLSVLFLSFEAGFLDVDVTAIWAFLCCPGELK